MKEYYTAPELADLARDNHWQGCPNSRRGWFNFIERENWAGTPLSRERQGKGGGIEYHYSLLPDRLMISLSAIAMRDAQSVKLAASKEVVKEERRALKTSSLSARQRAVMEARAAVLIAIDNVRIKDGSSRKQAITSFLNDPASHDFSNTVLATANDKRSGNCKISERTVFRWFSFREKGLGALAPNTSKPSGRVPEWFPKFMRFYAQPHKPTITEALEKFTDELEPGAKPPSYDQCKRLIAKMGNVDKHKGREGPLTFKSRLAYVMRTTDDMLPGIVYTADGKTFDAEIADWDTGLPIKPEVTTIMDVATRRVVGLTVGRKENALDVVDALRRATMAHGIPAIFYTDRGAGFKNKIFDETLTGFCARLSITKEHALPRNSQGRGLIERSHRTIWNKLAKDFPTYLGKDMDREASERVHKITRKEIKEFGFSRTLPTWEEFLDACQQAAAAYNRKSHSKLPGKMSPDQYWALHEGREFKPILVTEEEADDLWRPYVIRRARRGMVEWNTNVYHSEHLRNYHEMKVLVGYDRHDGSKVWVREIGENNDGSEMGRLICVAQFTSNKERYFPLSAEQAAVEKRAKGRMKRVMQKVDAIEQELNPATLLEAHARPVMHLVEQTEPELIVETEQPPQPKKLKFSSDWDLAEWVIKNPERMEEHQRSYLEQCLRRDSFVGVMNEKGLDVERLRNVLRQAA